MSEPQPEDSFSTALAEIERLLVVWDKLTTARVSVSATTRLIHQSIANLSLPGTYFDDTTFFPNFLRLVEIRNELVSRGITGSSLIKFMAEEFEGIKNAHSSWHNDGTPKSALRFLNSLDHWTTLNTMLENVSPTIHTIRGWITNIKGIISLDVKALPLQLDVSPDSLQLIEVGAGLLQALPHQHRAKISQVVDSQMKALTASSACTFGLNYEHDTASRAVLESNDDLIDLEAQTGNELSQIHRLQEQILQLKADNNELQQEKTSLTEEKTRLEGRVQSSETEMFGLKLRINNLQFEYAGLEEKFTTSKDEHQIVCSTTPASDR